MAPKRNSKNASVAHTPVASVSFVADDANVASADEVTDVVVDQATNQVADVADVADVVATQDGSTNVTDGHRPDSDEHVIDVADTPDEDEEAAATTDQRKGLSPMESLKEDMENMLEGATNLVLFAKELEARLKKNLKTLSKISRKRNSGSSMSKDSPKRETNLTKQIKISRDMASFAEIEGEEASRTLIVKTISDYSKRNGLKLESDKRVIVLDDVLAKLMNKDVGDNVRFCDVQKFIKHHFV